LLLAALAAISLAAIGVFVGPSSWAVPLDEFQQVATTCAALIAMVVVWRAAPTGQRWLPGGLALAFAVATTGMAAWAFVSGQGATAAGPAVFLLLLSLAIVAVVLLRVFTAYVEVATLGQLVLDCLIVIGAALCMLAPVWQWLILMPHRDPAIAAAAMAAIALVASSSAGYLVLFARGLTPSFWGPYAVLDGLLVVGAMWLIWLDTLAGGTAASVAPLDWGFSAAVLGVAWGGITWYRQPRPNEMLDRYGRAMVDALPLLAVGGSILAIVRAHETPAEMLVEVTAITVVLLALARQWLLARRERGAHAESIMAADELAREIRHRSRVLTSLVGFDSTGTAEDMARRICELAVEVEGVAQAAILAFEDDGTSTLLAQVGPASDAVKGAIQPADVAVRFRERAAEGAWCESLSDRSDVWADALRGAGLDMICNGPILFGERLLGRISLASVDGRSDLRAERIETARQFGLLAGAILGATLEPRARDRTVRQELARVIDACEFRIVFQPIVDLATGRIVGHEALTRFDDGVPPDVRFADAARAGLGVSLERVTIEAAIRSASGLPAGTYVSLNASPALVAGGCCIETLLDLASCPVVIEVTERDAVESYAELRASLGALRKRARIAVDDVGAGYAGLRHILEIEPDILKLDISLVRGVDADPTKGALVGSMVAFASRVGCVVLAEGVETEAEAEMLLRLGVGFGQGYLFGRPQPLAGAVSRRSAA
jgi:EAL domain-containing protein (putative c-di-GMP-specific phosphodiesterase class I)